MPTPTWAPPNPNDLHRDQIRWSPPHGDALPFRFDEMERHASGYLDTVRTAAAKIISQAKQEADSIRNNAEHDGQQAAIDTARRGLEKDVARQLESMLPAIRQAIDGLHQARADCLRAWEQNAVHLAAAIAARVIRGELSRQPEIPLALVREALELATGSPHITVRLHPLDHAALASHVASLTAELARQASGTKSSPTPRSRSAVVGSTPNSDRSISKSKPNSPASNRN